jgi:hypothetical protein
MSIIAGLQQAPGQAMPMGMGQPPMPGMKPPMGGAPAGVASLIPNLQQLPVQQLTALFLDPRSNVPRIALLSAIDQKIKQQKTMQAVQGAAAQQQAQQQPGTVAQEVLQSAMQPVMARHGGAMHGYNRGGIVGYANGTPPEGATSYPAGDSEEVKEWWEKLPEGALLRKLMESRAKEGSRRSRERFPTFYEGQPPLPVEQKPQEEEGMGSEIMRLMSRPSGEARYGELPTEAPAMPPAPPAPQVKPPPAEAQTQRPQVRPPAAVAKPDDLETLGKTLRNAGKMTPELEKDLRDARAAEMEIRRAALMGQESRAKEDYNRAKQRLEQELSKDRGISSARGLATLAASISTEPGQVFSSLGKGLEKVYAGEEAARSQARSNYDIARAAFRKGQDLMDERRVLIQERNTAIAERRVEQAMQAQQRLAEIDKEIYKLREERENASFTRETQRISAEAQRTQAGRESETDRKIRFAKEDPALFNQMYGKRLDPYQKAQLMDKASSNVLKDDKQLPVKISNAKAAAAKAGRPFDEQAFVDSLVNAEYERLIAAGEDRPIKSETPAAGDVARPTTQAAFDALPKGARYINPSDGKEYIKN